MEISEGWTSSFTEKVQNAIDLADDIRVEEALELLKNCETEIDDVFLSADTESTLLLRHLMNWLMLQRATILCGQARFDEARPIFRTVQELSTEFEVAFDGSPLGCFCHEFASATMELANLLAAVGRNKEGIETLINFHGKIQYLHQLPEQNIEIQIVEWIKAWGTELGYENVALTNDLSNGVSTKANDHLQFWSFPFPLRGELYRVHESNIDDLTRLRLETDSARLVVQYEVAEMLCAASESWLATIPSSVNVKLNFAVQYLSKARLEITMNEIGKFAKSLESLTILADLLAEFPQYVRLKLILARSIFHLVQGIFFHQFDGQDQMDTYSDFGRNLIEGVLMELENIRDDTPVTQDIAIAECTLLSLSAIGQDMIGQRTSAAQLRTRRDAILAELLVRDPNNEFAERLKETYLATPTPVDPKVRSEVHNWDWSTNSLS